jgi:hypothetical protein
MRHRKVRPNVELVATFPEDPTPVPLLQCIICDTSFESAVPEGFGENQPSEGTVFTSSGQYGSTAFDPLDGSVLEITICDPCLRAKAAKQRVLIGRFRRPVEINGMGIVGWERSSSPLRLWDSNEYRYDKDRRLLSIADLDNIPETVVLNIPVEAIKEYLSGEDRLSSP